MQIYIYIYIYICVGTDDSLSDSGEELDPFKELPVAHRAAARGNLTR
jgi:hypothetical protein